MRGPDCAMRGEFLEWALDLVISNNLNFADFDFCRAAVVACGAAIRLTQDILVMVLIASTRSAAAVTGSPLSVGGGFRDCGAALVR